MGKRVVHCGDAGAGQAAKICNNMILGIWMIGVCEAFVLAEKLGLSHQALFDVASTSSGQCWSLTSYCPVPGPVPASPANNGYKPGFAAALMLKDLRLAQEAAAARRRRDARSAPRPRSSTACSTPGARRRRLLRHHQPDARRRRQTLRASNRTPSDRCCPGPAAGAYGVRRTSRAEIQRSEARECRDRPTPHHPRVVVRERSRGRCGRAPATDRVRHLRARPAGRGAQTRRAVVVLAPVAVALLVLAALLDGENRPLRATLGRRARSWGGLAGGLALLWCALSLIWTPFLAPAAERLLNIAATLGLGLAAYAALPDRMRSANLYLVPVGAALAAAAAIGIALFEVGPGPVLDEDGQSLERGLVVLVLFLWPALAWLRSRGRDGAALALAALVTAAVLVGPKPLPLAGLAAGALVYVVTTLAPAFGTALTGAVLAGSLALAPVIPFIGRPVTTALLGRMDPTAIAFGIWRRVITGEPLRLVTGHGFETALRGRFVGLIPPDAPSTVLFEIWYELGLVGALAGAVALYASVRGTRDRHPSLRPGIMASFAAAFMLACLGIGTAQMWWFTALVVLVVLFVAAERGQVRTTRPKARFLRAANDA